MEVCYCMTRREAWRFNTRMLFGKPGIWLTWALYPAGITWYTYWQYPAAQASLYLRSPHIWWLPAMFFGTYGVLTGVFLALIWKLTDSHYPDTEPPLVSKTVLTPEGLEDTQRKLIGRRLTLTQIHVPWQKVTRIYQQDADIYFQRKAGSNVIP